MSGATRVASAGVRDGWLVFYDNNGNITGGTPTAPANGLSSHADPIVGIKTASPTTPEPDIVQDTGDDTLIAEFPFDSIATRSFDMDVAVYDLDQVAALQTTNVVTWGDAKFGAEDIDGAPELDTMIIYNHWVKKQDVGATRGKSGYEVRILPVNSTKFLGRVSSTEREAAVYRYRVIPQKASQAIGLTIQSAFGTAGLRRLGGSADNPMAFTRASGDGTTTAFNVLCRPVSAAKVYVVVVPPGYATGGIVATVTSVNRTSVPYTVTLQSAPAAGAKVYILYEYDQKGDQ